MKVRLLATASQRSAHIERMQKVASTRPAAAKPTALVISWSLEPCISSRLHLLDAEKAQRVFVARRANWFIAAQWSETGGTKP
jgi:hypothetical protein